MQLTDIQRGMMRHALGLNWSKNAYRNRYITSSPESAAAWDGLCEKGLAMTYFPGAFKVTKAGFAEVALPGEMFDAETFIGAKAVTGNKAEVKA